MPIGTSTWVWRMDLNTEVTLYGYSKVSRQYGLNFEALKARFAEVIGNFGREGIRRFAIAVKLHDRGWPREFATAIRDARQKYDRGSHELCQGRSGKYTVLYLIPRLVWTKPRSYFRTLPPSQ